MRGLDPRIHDEACVISTRIAGSSRGDDSEG
jgi:hypothetical protein